MFVMYSVVRLCCIQQQWFICKAVTAAVFHWTFFFSK